MTGQKTDDRLKMTTSLFGTPTYREEMVTMLCFSGALFFFFFFGLEHRISAVLKISRAKFPADEGE